MKRTTKDERFIGRRSVLGAAAAAISGGALGSVKLLGQTRQHKMLNTLPASSVNGTDPR
jgi:hypothetical protein